jgi:hypothetical protein
LALSNKALDRLAELLDGHILVPRSVHLLPLRSQSLVCVVDVALEARELERVDIVSVLG